MWIIASSAGLSEVDKEMLKQLQQASGACVASKFKANVTHIVCGKLDQGLARCAALLTEIHSKQAIRKGRFRAL